MIHAPGIYFGLDADPYHADRALGSTSIKDLALDPVDWQYDQLHGTDAETPALVFGSALHARVLEGSAAFENQFYRKAQKAEYPEAMITADDIRSFLRNNGTTVGGKKEDIIDRASGLPDCPPIWDLIEAEHERLNEGRTALTQRQWEAITVAAQWMQQDQWLKDVMIDGTFIGGMPEVSVFYEVDGVRLKARFDYLAKHAIFDLKSFAVMFKENASAAIGKTIGRQRYDLQAAAYIKAWQAGRELWKAGQVFGECPKGFLSEVYDRPFPLWIWIMLKTTGAPQCYVRPFDQRSNAYGFAVHQVETAIKAYSAAVAEFGIDADWIPNNPVHSIEDTDLPAWVGR
jgi:hypothetical protein